jgi:hypothetical protein
MKVPYRWVCSLYIYFDDPDNRKQLLVASSLFQASAYLAGCGRNVR